MRVAFVVQRYGLEVNGGSELHCRQVVERMMEHWDVEVLTTCAVDYITWKDEYPSGVTRVNNVPVRRFRVDAPRNIRHFNRLSEKVLGTKHTYEEEMKWVRAQGPYSTEFLEYLEAHRDEYDFFIFFTYLYGFTFFGLPLVSEKSALVSTAHDEPTIYLDIYRELFRLPRIFIFNTPWERAFINGRFGTEETLQEVVGVGIEAPDDVNPERFTRKYAGSLEGYDFILYVGRVDRSKGCLDLINKFVRFREEVPSPPLKLALIGSPVMEIPRHPDIVPLGFVSDEDKFDGIAASRVVVLPSPYESLSMVALEAWQLRKPVLANGISEALVGQCCRSNGGLWYDNYAEFREALSLILESQSLSMQLGKSGHRFVSQTYGWDKVVESYLRLINTAVSLRSKVHEQSESEAVCLAAPVLRGDSDELGRLKDYLMHSIVTLEVRDELIDYLHGCFTRLLYTLPLIPQQSGTMLELGANPYFFTLMLKKFTNYDLKLANFFGSRESAEQEIYNDKYGEHHLFSFEQFNVEEDPFPYGDQEFDIVLFCEIIEHLVRDPVRALSEIHRVLRDDGILILVTPNVSRSENVAKLTQGENIYDPYSGYGLYGRHNREYTPWEIKDLLEGTGFVVDVLDTKDASKPFHPPLWGCQTDSISIEDMRGEYVFVRAYKKEKFRWYHPNWLFRSGYPSEPTENENVSTPDRPMVDYPRNWKPKDIQEAIFLATPGLSLEEFVELGEIHTEMVLKHLPCPPQDARVLEIGCGIGRLVKQLAPFVKIIYAADVSEEMLTIARGQYCQEISNVHFVCNQQGDLAFLSDCSVDLVCSFYVFQHMMKEHAYRYVAEAHRVLTPQGTVLFHFPNLMSEGYWQAFQAGVADPSLLSESEARMRFWTTQEVEFILEKAGFTSTVVSTDVNEIYATAHKP